MEKFVHVNGFRTRYLEYEPGNKNKSGNDFTDHILLIHGLGASADRWLDIPEALSKSYHTLAIVLLDSSGLLTAPTSLLDQYFHAALYPSFDNVKNVFQQMMANPSSLGPALVNLFIFRINMPNAKYS